MLLHIFLSIFCIVKYKWQNLATLASILYSINAVCSFFLYNFPLLYSTTYAGKGICSMDACIYWFSINSLLILSLAKTSINNITEITYYNESFLIKIEKILCVILSVLTIFEFPSSLSTFLSSDDLAELREMSVESQSGFFVIDLFQHIFGATSLLLLCIITIRGIVNNELSMLDKYGIFVYFLNKINIILANVSRATIIWILIELLVVFLLFYVFLSSSLRRRITRMFIILSVSLYFIFSAISVARFGSGGETAQNFSTLRYAGESGLNFMSLAYKDLKEPFWGYIQFPLYRRILGLDFDKGKDRDFVYNTHIRDNLLYPNPVYIFHGLTGDLFMNFGWTLTLIIAVSIFLYMRLSIRSDSTQIATDKIFFIIILASVICKGIFYADYRSETGNFLILFVIFISIYSRLTGTVQELPDVYDEEDEDDEGEDYHDDDTENNEVKDLC